MVQVLLVDDDEDDQFIFSEAIKLCFVPSHVWLASSHNELFDLLPSIGSPDLIFLDINMPGYDGIKCLETIRANAAYQAIPVIMYSTSGRKESIDKCFEKGADFYIQKPSQIDDLVKVLNKVFSKNWTPHHEILTPRENFVIY